MAESDEARSASDRKFLIYGAYGYTGALIARAALDRGLRPILGGRRPQPLSALAEELGLEWEAFQLESEQIVRRRLEEVDAVLHCAGPFARNFSLVSNCCLETGTHYLDITGEIDVFESLAARDNDARERGVVLLPGVGFDVVPTDCLALHLSNRLPAAQGLSLAIDALGELSRGTALTALEGVKDGGRVRVGGRLVRVPPADRSRTVDFGRPGAPRVKECLSIPWGDVSTAYQSTGIPDIDVYAAMPAARRWMLRSLRLLGPLIATRPVQAFLKGRVRAREPGPGEGVRSRGRCYLWGEARRGQERVESVMETPEAYSLTVDAALSAVERVLAGNVEPGFQTPSRAFGADFALELPGVKRWDRP